MFATPKAVREGSHRLIRHVAEYEQSVEIRGAGVAVTEATLKAGVRLAARLQASSPVGPTTGCAGVKTQEESESYGCRGCPSRWVHQ